MARMGSILAQAKPTTKTRYWNYGAFACYLVLVVLLLIKDEPNIPAAMFLLAAVVLLTAWNIALRFRLTRYARAFEVIAYISAMVGIFVQLPHGASMLTAFAAAHGLTMLLVTGLLFWTAARK